MEKKVTIHSKAEEIMEAHEEVPENLHFHNRSSRVFKSEKLSTIIAENCRLEEDGMYLTSASSKQNVYQYLTKY